MASKNFSGVLRDPLGTLANNDKYRFTHVSTTGEVIRGSTSYLTIGDDGVYNIDIEYGNVSIESYSELGKRWIAQGTTTINADTTVTTLPALLNALVPASDALILQLEAILADAESAATSAVSSAAIATDAASSASTDAASASANAVIATDAATSATASASSAASDAQTAVNAASSANTSATIATNAATSAENDASDAAASATSAEQSAIDAALSAATAEDAAIDAQAAADAATLNGGIYETTAAGLAATVDGDYFSVVSADSESYLDLYKNESNVAEFKKSYPSIQGVSSLTDEYISENLGIKLEKTYSTTNVFNTEDVTLDTGVRPEDGTTYQTSSYDVSGFIPVDPSQVYSGENRYDGNVFRRVVYFDAGKDYISSDNGFVNQFTTPSTAAFVRLMIPTNNGVPLSDIVLNKGETVTYEPYVTTRNLVSSESLNTDDENSLVTRASLSINTVKNQTLSNTNILNPDGWEIGVSIGPDGRTNDSADYNVTGYIPVSELTEYTGVGTYSGLFRRALYYNDDKTLISSKDTGGDFDNFTTSAGTTQVRLVVFNENSPADVALNKGSTASYEPYIIKESVDLVGGNDLVSGKSIVTKDILDSYDSDSSITVNLSNANKIMFTGSSSVESFYTPKGKSWCQRIQDLTDWAFIPYGWSGNNANEIAEHLYADDAAPSAAGVKPSDINPTYTYIGQTINSADMLGETTDEDYVASNVNLAHAAMSVTGSKLIVGTMYRTEQKPWIENSLKNIADKFDAEFMPFGTYTSEFIRNGAFAGFYGSGHPGIRTNECYTNYIAKYMDRFRRPEQGILIFNARDVSETNADLVVTDIDERAVKFMSISVGERSIDTADEGRYDSLTPYDYGIGETNNSEYLALLKGDTISLKDKALIEFIVPTVRNSTGVINIEQTGVTNAYLLDMFTKTWVEAGIIGNEITINSRKYYDYDKVRLLLTGSSLTLSDISITVSGGVKKPLSTSHVEPPRAGETIIASEGFDDATITNWEIGDNTRYNQTDKYSSDFYDVPLYLGESKDVITLTSLMYRNFTLADDSFGYRKLRIWTVARINPLIYNPTAYGAWVGDDNPYTNISWYDEDSFDYDYMDIVVTHRDAPNSVCRSINKQRVGLFWSLAYVDVEIPVTRAGHYQLRISRGTNHTLHNMEICDVQIELI